MALSQPMEEWTRLQWRPNKISVYFGIIVESMAAIRSVMLIKSTFFLIYGR
jgi:hypothetical protein